MRLVSILGDSVSTFEGYNPLRYSVFYDKEVQQKNGMKTVYDTWWAKVIQALKAHLCVNNSYSGSQVTGITFPAGNSDERLLNLCTETHTPDIILVYLGFNDFAKGVRIRRNNYFKKDFFSFEYTYSNMLARMKKRYKNSTIICGTLMRSSIKGQRNWVFPDMYAGINIEDYNDAIRRACKRRKCMIADLANQPLRYETLDSSHPTAEGHKTIAHAWINSLCAHGLINMGT